MTDKNIKLIALDIDGTIMGKDYRISDRVKQTISRAVEKGIHVLIATGRMYSATVPIGVELDLKTPLIVYQGSLIKEFYKSNRTLLHHHLDTEISLDIVENLRKENVQINVYLDDKLYVESDSLILQKYIARRNITFYMVDGFENIENFLPTKILALDSNPEKINTILARFKEKYSKLINMTKSTDYFCEFINKKCSKADGIMFLAEKLGVNRSQIMAIGDHDNDREMIDLAEVGVAMGNSHDEFKKAADYVTDSVENDGAAIAIEKFALCP